ncbi:transglycosylase SLT domain-containing protein [Bdellovibrio reynosensis]|uniref:Transglycosylase SLT domain-containing protein n=1 Tax=Bdellovibrio reynosensis TaxID=2835041 RepID=A0ABY4CH21_9BACT|nr:transglycosylase SLT domain-containing protein [Bdellovibrio reynosensis]UOF01510.1 transglycosylase SLT domain-containing protein [Bdellovibrio reynosensis]
MQKAQVKFDLAEYVLKSSLLFLIVWFLIGCGEMNSSLTALAIDTNAPASTNPEPGTEVPTTPTPAPVPEPVYAPVIPLWESEVSDGKNWTKHVKSELDRIGRDLLSVLPLDRTTFCPNYRNLKHENKKDFWAYLLSQMVRYESNFDTTTRYEEDFDDSNGDPVISRGLLQISIESGNDYGCAFDRSSDLHDPLQNLSCGIRILNRWMENDHRIASKVDGDWKGGARYWSVLRNTSDSYPKIVSAMKAISICK